MKPAIGVLLEGVIALAAMSIPAQANNVYLSVEGGGAFLTDSDLSDNLGNSAEVSFDAGYALSASIGYRFKKFSVRAEAQFNHQNNALDSASALGTTVSAGGDATINSGMANVYYDFKLKSDKWSPYVGAGLGFAAIDISNPSVIAGGIKLTGNDLDDTVFAYQIMAGIGYNISKNITLPGGYKYFGAADATFTGDINASVDSHNLFVGLRYNF